jgi:phosphatidylserine decarboxylase
VSAAYAALQRALPQHALSRLVGRLARSETRWIRRPFIHAFARAYGVDLADAERGSLDDYASFNDFFTRALKPGARPPDPDPAAIVCPADGTISQAGPIREDRLLQAKGHHYTLRALVGDDAPEFHGGSFLTVYLAPADYHRVHLPLAGRLISTTAIPGHLFSVSARTETAITDLFCRNERLVARFEHADGPFLVVLVGAMIVASIETVWGGPASPYRGVQRDSWNRAFARGDEIGRFLLGSTVILCLPPGPMQLVGELAHGTRVRVGQRVGAVDV